MKEEFTYQYFQEKKEFEKIELLDSIYEDNEPSIWNTRDIKNFFNQLLFDEHCNDFLKLKSLKILIWLTSTKRLSEAYTFDTYLDVSSEDPFVIIQKIKGLFLLGVNNKEVNNLFNELKNHRNADIASEAYFNDGLKHFFQTPIAADFLEALDLLQIAKSNFEMAVKIVENRTDGEIFLECCKIVSSLLTDSLQNRETLFSHLSQKLFEYQHKSINKKLPEIDEKIYENLMDIYLIKSTAKNSDAWYDYRSELSFLNKHMSKFLTEESQSSVLEENIFSPWRKNTHQNYLKTFIKSHLQSKAGAISRLRKELPSEEIDLKRYLDNLIDDFSKKKDKISHLDKAILYQLFPKMERHKVDEVCNKRNIPLEALEIIAELMSLKEDQLENDLTPEEKEIFSKLKYEINLKVPGYTASKIEFLEILKLTIRYVKIGFERSDNIFNVLYGGKKYSEDDFQQSLFTFLLAGKSAKFESEKPQYADGGRIDLTFSNNSSDFPIEIKKTEKIIRRDIVKKNFLPQAQAYISPNNQLGLFVLFDVSDKRDSVLPNIRNLFWTESLDSTYDIPIDYPDCVVVILVPANKVSPSSKSTYG